MSQKTKIEHPFLEKLDNIIGNNLSNEQFGVSELAEKLGMSRSNLHRKVKTLTGKSASWYIREQRLRKALEMLKQKEGNVSEIAYQVGFSSVTYFSKCFHDYFGKAPGELLNGNRTITFEEKSDSTEKRYSLNKTTFYFLIAITVLATAVVIMLVQGGGISSSSLSVMIYEPEPLTDTKMSISASVHGLTSKLQQKLNALNRISLKTEQTSEYYQQRPDISLAQINEKGIKYIIDFEISINNDTNIKVNLIDTERDEIKYNEFYSYQMIEENEFDIKTQIIIDLAKTMLGDLSEKEMESIRDNSSINQHAQNHFNRGCLYLKNARDNKDWAKGKYHLIEAIKADSTFAEAYVWLAHHNMENLHYWAVKYNNEKRAEELLDSGLLLVNKALSFNSSLGWAWSLKALYYFKLKNYSEANKYYAIADTYESREFEKYRGLMMRSLQTLNYSDFLKNFSNYYKTKPADEIELPYILRSSAWNLFYMDFQELAVEQARKLGIITDNEDEYYNYRIQAEMKTGDFKKAENTLHSYFPIASTKNDTIRSLFQYIYVNFFQGKEAEAYEYLLKLENLFEEENEHNNTKLRIDDELPIAWLYLQNIREAEAMEMLNTMEKNSKNYMTAIDLSYRHGFAEFTLAGIYAIQNKKEEAIKMLQKLSNKKPFSKFLIVMIENYPFFDNLRNEADYKKTMKKIKKEFNREHRKLSRTLKRAELI